MLRGWGDSAISLGIALLVLLSFVVPAQGREDGGLSVRIVDLQRGGPVLRVDLRVAGLEQDAEKPQVTLQAAPDGHPIWATVAFRIPSRFSVDIDLKAGRVRVGGVSVGEFEPVPRLEENTQFPILVTVVQGSARASDRRTAMLPLPTVIVPGYLNDLQGAPDPNIMSVLARRGYQASGASRDLFWFAYPSRRLPVEDAALALARYVRSVVLPSTYASRINVVGYSLGGLLARWNIAFEPRWDQLVNRLILVGVPNEGTVMGYVYAYYPAAGMARTAAARSLLPTFPFWRATPGSSWSVPVDAQNAALAALNTQFLPDGIHVYAFYGSGQATDAGLTGNLPDADVAYGPGDGVVLAASALGLPINGGTGIDGLTGRLGAQVDLGSVRHGGLLDAAASRIGDVLLDRFRVRSRATFQETRSRNSQGTDDFLWRSLSLFMIAPGPTARDADKRSPLYEKGGPSCPLRSI